MKEERKKQVETEGREEESKAERRKRVGKNKER